jgi:hypothetical protein
VRPSQQEIKPIPVYRVLIDLQIDATIHVGVHSLRLVSPRGVSNAIGFPVVESSVTVEAAGSRRTVEQSQPVSLPGFISGKIGEPGEVDFYSFQVKKGQELRFEVVEGQRFDPSADAAKFSAELALYHALAVGSIRILAREGVPKRKVADLMPATLERTDSLKMASTSADFWPVGQAARIVLIKCAPSWHGLNRLLKPSQ